MRRRERNRTRRRAQGEVIVRNPGSLKPFKSLHEHIAKMHAIADKNLPPLLHQEALQALPPVRSRGHGARYRIYQVVAGSRRDQDRSKYNPRTEDRKHAGLPA